MAEDSSKKDKDEVTVDEKDSKKSDRAREENKKGSEQLPEEQIQEHPEQ